LRPRFSRPTGNRDRARLRQKTHFGRRTAYATTHGNPAGSGPMTCTQFRPAMLAAVAAAVVGTASITSAQDAGQSTDPTFGILGPIFNGSERFAPQPAPAPNAAAPPANPAPAPGPGPRIAQGGGDLTVRLERLEAQIRQLTGIVEQLQYRNQQLEGQLRRLQEEAGLSRPAPARPAAIPQPNPAAGAGAGRRGDAFDPTTNPTAPGAPRIIGSTPPTRSVPPRPAGASAEPPRAPAAR